MKNPKIASKLPKSGDGCIDGIDFLSHKTILDQDGFLFLGAVNSTKRPSYLLGQITLYPSLFTQEELPILVSNLKEFQEKIKRLEPQFYYPEAYQEVSKLSSELIKICEQLQLKATKTNTPKHIILWCKQNKQNVLMFYAYMPYEWQQQKTMVKNACAILGVHEDTVFVDHVRESRSHKDFLYVAVKAESPVEGAMEVDNALAFLQH